MKQSRCMSLVEAGANVLVGYGIAVATQAMVFSIFGLQASLPDNLLIGAIFTVISIVRSYSLRRLFEALRAGSARWSTRLSLPDRRFADAGAENC